MPLGFATAQEDGTILRENSAAGHSAFPLENVQTTYGGYSGPSPASFPGSPPTNFPGSPPIYPGPSPTSTFASSRRPVADRSSSSSTLLGEENYFACMLPYPLNLLHGGISVEADGFVGQTQVLAHPIRPAHMAKMAKEVVRVSRSNSNTSSSSFNSWVLGSCGF